MSAPADLALASFSDTPPWLLHDLDSLPWRAGLEEERQRLKEMAPGLVTPSKRMPRGRHAAGVLSRIAFAGARFFARDLVPLYARAVRPKQLWSGKAFRRPFLDLLSLRLVELFGRLGPTYIKLGQLVASSPGLFPEEVVARFATLRDQVPQESLAAMREVIEEDFGRPLEDLFSEFEPEADAAASIAQVHRARLRTGEPVVVKVQRPGLRKLVLDDIAILAYLAPHLQRRVPVSAIANPPGVVELFAETILEELDFRIEAENMLDMGGMLARCGLQGVIVPRPHPELVSRRVLVMERLEGIAFHDVDAMRDAGIDTHELLFVGMLGFLEGAMVEGIFHGDLHAGNVLVTADGRYALVDFGITGRLDEAARRCFIRLLFNAARGDVKGQFRALADLGAFPPGTDIERFIKEVGADQQPVDVLEIAPEELQRQFQQVTKTLQVYGVKFPKDLMLFIKNFLYMDGAIARLAPDLNIIKEAERILLTLASKYADLVAELVGPASDLVVGGLTALGGTGIPEEQMDLTWNRAQERREEVARRMGEARKRRRK